MKKMFDFFKCFNDQIETATKTESPDSIETNTIGTSVVTNKRSRDLREALKHEIPIQFMLILQL